MYRLILDRSVRFEIAGPIDPNNKPAYPDENWAVIVHVLENPDILHSHHQINTHQIHIENESQHRCFQMPC